MKCVSIVYKKSNQPNIMGDFIPIRSTKKTVQSYYQKLIQKQQSQKDKSINNNQIVRTCIGTSRSFRSFKRQSVCPMADSINILPIRASTGNLIRSLTNPQIQIRNQKKFRTTLVKRNDSANFFNLKGIKQNYQQFMSNQRIKLSSKVDMDEIKKHAKLKNLKKLKLIKPTTVLISIDFILNQNNFWTEQHIEQNCFKNWKTLQECSNVVWITKRENSFKKLQKYAHQYGLRLDGVYQIMPKKKSPTLNFTLRDFQKDFSTQVNFNKNQKYRNQIIFINSLKVESIKDLGYQQFYNTFPIVKSIKCIVHFIQIDINDKHRFNSPLKILSKDKLPNPNSVFLFFKNYYENEGSKILQFKPINHQIEKQEEKITRQQMLQKFQDIRKDCIDYFSQNLRINMNKKIKIQNSQISLQYLIGDMLKRNFNLMYSYRKESHEICKKLNMIKDNKQNGINEKNINLTTLLNSKLQTNNMDIKQNKNTTQQDSYFKFPVFFWKM